jgi:hypothetical protein
VRWVGNVRTSQRKGSRLRMHFAGDRQGSCEPREAKDALATAKICTSGRMSRVINKTRGSPRFLIIGLPHTYEQRCDNLSTFFFASIFLL